VDLERVKECLEEMGLGYLGGGKGLDWEDDWGHRLSRGESQRIAIARVLYHHPQVRGKDVACETYSLRTDWRRNKWLAPHLLLTAGFP